MVIGLTTTQVADEGAYMDFTMMIFTIWRADRAHDADLLTSPRLRLKEIHKLAGAH